MSESWMQLLSSAILGWVALELRLLRKDVNSRVHYHDCDRRMKDLDRRLERMERFMD